MSKIRVRPQRLVLIGSVLVDILLYIDQIPERGGDRIAQRAFLTSGGGFNVLAGAARLGMPAAYAGRIGDGIMGEQVIHDLTALDISLLLPRVRGGDTGFDVGLVESDAERTFVTSPGVEAHLTHVDLQALVLQEGDAIYVSGYDLYYPVSGAALAEWLPTLAAHHLLLLDPGPLVAGIPAERLERVLGRVDIMSLNERELSLISGALPFSDALQHLINRIASDGWVVARRGAGGCWLVHATQPGQHIPPRLAQAVDTTGAGDTHVAALLARLAAGDDIYSAARRANVAASLSTEKAGSATGPTAQELEEAFKLYS